MADSKISALISYTNPDPINDVLPIVDTTNTTTKKISRNNLLGITSAPVGKDDTQTLTAKTLTAPTINGATLSGTLSGTYTIGGTPTFPSSVVTLTGSQTLTNKILTSPTINAPTITNASITADAITGFSSANTGTIYGVAITAGVISGANTVASSALATASVLAAKLGLSSGLTGGVATQVNAGSAGGNMFYINLGGIKLCWGQTATQAQGAGYNITLPTSFFSTIQSVTTTSFAITVTANQFTSINSASTTTIQINFESTTGTGTAQAFYLVIGT